MLFLGLWLDRGRKSGALVQHIGHPALAGHAI
jgi:hypothetical protein